MPHQPAILFMNCKPRLFTASVPEASQPDAPLRQLPAQAPSITASRKRTTAVQSSALPVPTPGSSPCQRRLASLTSSLATCDREGSVVGGIYWMTVLFPMTALDIVRD